VTAVQPPGRFGALSFGEGDLTRFVEKPLGDGTWVNGGFFVASPKALEYVADDDISWEVAPMEKLGEDGQLVAFRHRGFWHAVDTMRDKAHLEDLWNTGRAPWKTWDRQMDTKR
jgi:glucose-1-phosphate cytidylyltransferase